MLISDEAQGRWSVSFVGAIAPRKVLVESMRRGGICPLRAERLICLNAPAAAGAILAQLG